MKDINKYNMAIIEGLRISPVFDENNFDLYKIGASGVSEILKKKSYDIAEGEEYLKYSLHEGYPINNNIEITLATSEGRDIMYVSHNNNEIMVTQNYPDENWCRTIFEYSYDANGKINIVFDLYSDTRNSTITVFIRPFKFSFSINNPYVLDRKYISLQNINYQTYLTYIASGITKVIANGDVYLLSDMSRRSWGIIKPGLVLCINDFIDNWNSKKRHTVSSQGRY